MKNDALSHHGVAGMKWGVRKKRDQNGNLTRYGARSLSRSMNKSNTDKNTLYMPVKYKDRMGKAHTVYQLNSNQVSNYKKKVATGAVIGTVVGGLPGGLLMATLSSKKYQIDRGREITNSFLNDNVNYTTVIGDDKSLQKYTNRSKN